MAAHRKAIELGGEVIQALNIKAKKVVSIPNGGTICAKTGSER